MRLTGATFCSGIGAPEVAAPAIDWCLASEIERFPRAVLRHRHGYADAGRTVPAGSRRRALWGDFTALRVRHMRRLGIVFPNIVVAGTPCQAFSLAGRRQSLADARGNLTLQFVRMVHAFKNAERRDGRDGGPVRGTLRYVVWENVPGVLSTRDNAFGCFLGGLVGADDPFVPFGRWPGAGMVSGPRARAAWRVFNAQYFRVPQRRRRVFVVADFGDDPDPAAILFERQVVPGNSAPGEQSGEEVAPTLTRGSPRGGRTPGLSADDAEGLIVVSSGDVAHCLNGGGMGRQDYESETLIAHTLRGECFDASEDGTGCGIPLVPVAFDPVQITSPVNRSNPQPDDPCHTLNCGAGAPLIAFSSKDHGADAAIDLAPTLRAGGSGGPRANAGAPPAVTAAAGGQGGVRRLTPRECERLQSFPDDYTLIPGYGGHVFKDAADAAAMAGYLGFTSVAEMEDFNPPADGPRYRALGNSMNVTVMRWILSRIVSAHVS